MEQEILNRFEEQNKKLDNIYQSVEKTRKYFLWAMIITIATIILPLIGLLFIVPQFINIYSANALGL